MKDNKLVSGDGTPLKKEEPAQVIKNNVERAIANHDRIRFKPLADGVLVRAFSMSRTKAGIIVPDTVDKTTDYGEVVAVGPGGGAYNEVMVVEKGQTVMFPKEVGIDMNIGGIDYVLLHQADIRGVIVALDENGQEIAPELESIDLSARTREGARVIRDNPQPNELSS